MGYIFVYTTFPNPEEAAAAARTIVERQFAACANIFPAGRTFYQWNGGVVDTAEAIVIFKTKADLWENLRAAIEALHSYEVPAIISFTMNDANAPFLAWLEKSVGKLQ